MNINVPTVTGATLYLTGRKRENSYEAPIKTCIFRAEHLNSETDIITKC
jgi:hypothetical protein